VELSQPNHTLETFEAALASSGLAVYVLRLYITGTTPKSDAGGPQSHEDVPGTPGRAL